MILFAWYWWVVGAFILAVLVTVVGIGAALIAVTLASAWREDGPPEEGGRDFNDGTSNP